MSRAIYIVLLSRDRWWVDLEGKAFGPFPSKDSARQEATSLARFMTHTGRQSEVRVPDEDGHYRVVWESEPYRFRMPPPLPEYVAGPSDDAF